MKKERMLLIASFIGIIFILFLSNHSGAIVEGKIVKIKINEKSTFLYLNNTNKSILILNKTILNLKIDCYIKIYSIENDNNTIFVDKVTLVKC